MQPPLDTNLMLLPGLRSTSIARTDVSMLIPIPKIRCFARTLKVVNESQRSFVLESNAPNSDPHELILMFAP